MTNVTKADGTKQSFDRDKVFRTCSRMRVSQDLAEEITSKIEGKLYEGIKTKQILQMIFRYVAEYRPNIKHQIDLREAICLLRPKPDFEQFVVKLLEAEGYDVISNQIVSGVCVEHEIDAIANKVEETVYVEVKHHFQPHTYTGLGVFLEAQATFEDLVEGNKLGKNRFSFSNALVVCNTKISDHAKRYAECRNIQHIGWKSPYERGLEFLIEDYKLYPITLLKGLDKITEAKLGDAGIILVKQLAESDARKLSRVSNVQNQKLNELIAKSQEIME